ncbi:MAG TPA: glycosyltransferase family 39 protein, partial [Ktedonobacteraceae bacterium]|nr:glycosyltransferase family 39 protein [Ktedonobacteraceae bacterium]
MDIAVDSQTSSRHRMDVLVTWKRLAASWELYPLLALAAFTRFYHLNVTEFDADQANIFRMAHDAVSHGHLVATSNIASLGIYNPPAIIYLLMIPAAFSANPLGGAIFTALLGLIAVLFSYIFVRRYYGRLTAAIVAVLFAIMPLAVSYSRFMWNQNLLPSFVLLFIASLFWGVVERRKGWLAPAMILLGLLIQLHGTGLLMGLPFVIALLLAPRSTLRWRDLFIGIFGLLVLYSPYLLWLVYSHYRDIHYLLTTPITNQTSIDGQALNTYQYFLHPSGNQSTPPTSVMYALARYSDLVYNILTKVLLA